MPLQRHQPGGARPVTARFGRSPSAACGGRNPQECGFAARQQHLDLYRKHFKRALLVLSDDLVYALAKPAERQALHRYALTNGFSYRDDSILVNGYLAGYGAPAELQAELDGLGLSPNSRRKLIDWVGATAHRSGPGCPVDRRPAL